VSRIKGIPSKGEPLSMATLKSQYGVRDGFLVRGEEFVLPSGLHRLDSETQYQTEICNLFINEKFRIPDIVEITRDDYATIVLALLNQKLIVVLLVGLH
jgi:hypothetical protein